MPHTSPHVVPPDARILVVVNGAARIDTDVAVSEIRLACPELATLIVRYTEPGVSIADLVADDLPHIDLAIAIGGDGTVSQVAAAVEGLGIPVGIIPAGSTNMVAKVSGIPSDPKRAARLIFGRHRLQMIDIGASGEYRLIHAGGAGLDARIFESTDDRLKRVTGWLAYLPAALRNLNSPSSWVRVEVDGTAVEAVSRFIFLANSSELVSAKFPIYPGVGREDGIFDVLIFTADDPLTIADTFRLLVAGKLQDSPHVIHLSGSNIRIEADPPMPVEFDGDVAGSTPLTVEVRARALQLIVPAES